MPVSARADPVTNAFAGLPPIVFRHYPVHGRTPSQIFASLRASGLSEQGNSTTTGRTLWRANFTWDFRRGSWGCRTLNPRTIVELIVTLPRLSDPEGATPAGLAWWQNYIATLERHEAGHVRIAVAHNRDFEREAQGASCENIHAIGRRITARVTELQAEYDRRTNHGEAQGDMIE